MAEPNQSGPDNAEPAQITSTIDPAVNAGIFGYIDSIDPRGIQGWLLDLGDEAATLEVDVYLGTSRISSAETGLERPDVAVVLGRQTFCGFHVPWLREPLLGYVRDLSDSQSVSLRVTARRDGRPIGAEMPVTVADVRRWIASLPEEAEQFARRVETLSPFRVSGYVFDRMNPDEPVVLEILVDGEPIAELRADEVRSGQSETSRPVNCGFQWSVPVGLRDGVSRRINIRVKDSGHLLLGNGAPLKYSPATRNQATPRLKKALSLSPGPVWTTGWAVDAESDEPLAVELFVDGQRVGETLAGQYGPDLDSNPQYGFTNAHTRFSFPTPRAAADGWMHEFRLHVKSWGGSQPKNAVVKWARGDCFGHLDKCEGTRVSGWVAFRDEPDRKRFLVPVEVFLDGALIGQCFLGELRPDVAESASQFAYGFQGDLGCEILGNVSVRFEEVDLKGSPKLVAPVQKLEGRVDRVDRSSISGWATDVNRSDEKVELELRIDGHLIHRFKATESRPDVRKALGLASPNVGFSIPTPEFVRDGEKHLIEVRFFASQDPLKGSGATVQFQRNAHNLPMSNPHPVLAEFISRRPRPFAAATKDGPVVSIVVLNRNGEDILDALLSSFVAVNSFARYEFVVVDHASKDSSVAILEKWSERGVPIKTVTLRYNGSFSASNNLAIKEHARGEYVLLLNNDIVFVQDVLPELIRTLQENPRVGLAGVKLLDVVEDRGRNFYPPIQHLGIRYRYAKQGVVPYDEKLSPDSACDSFCPVAPAGVTGAVMLCRRAEYLAVGGLEEAYFYGYEDVDLCLKYRVLNKQDIVCRNDLTVLHHRGYSRLSGREMGVFDRLDRNHLVLSKRWGYAIRSLYRQSLFRGDRVYSSERVRVAFAVTETGPEAVAGDYFTALELARALAEYPHVEPVFLSERDNWYDLEGVHVLVVMRHDYDLRCGANVRPDLVKLAWLRNHFEAWCEQRWFDRFDLYLSSAPKFVDRLSELGYRAELFPIATNLDAMKSGEADADLRCVVGFNGSAWAVERSVVQVFQQVAQSMTTTIVGRGWESSTISASYRGFLPYDRMPAFYASADIVVDDANESARLWGSANSRVFDSIAAGTLVITNSIASSSDLFQGRLPVWSSAEEAVSLVRKYSADSSARQELVEELRAMVAARHTYRHRAARLLELLQEYATEKFRIAIKVPVPNASEKPWWGDWHFAESLSTAFKAMGHSVRIDLLCDWGKPATNDDVVIVLRGLSEYTPDPAQINLLWILSHPESVSVAECGKYDYVFSASEAHTAYLESLGVSAATLLQCTDPGRMHPVSSDLERRHEHLFVGNSRGQSRKIVSDLVKIGVDISIFGREWNGLVPDHMLKGDLIPNEELGGYYGNAGVVYNDHWPDMAKWGFLSNRLFDAAACGAYVVSDEVDGLDDVFAGLIESYGSVKELAELSSPSAISRWDAKRAAALRNIVLSRHTFAHRATTLLAKARELSDVRVSGPTVLQERDERGKQDVTRRTAVRHVAGG